MNSEQVVLVKESFALVEPIADVAADLFYGRLFEIEPSTQSLFRGDMAEQKSKLMATLAFVVKGLDAPETILPAVEQLGKRHVGYGVTNEQYAPVGAALLWALERGLAEAFTPEVEEAWTAAYTLLADVMTGAAAEIEGEAELQVA